MSKYVVVSDKSGKNDQQCIEKVVQYLKDKGHDAVGGGVNSNSESRLWQEGKDTIGIFLVNGACLGTMLSLGEMVQKGHCSSVFIGASKTIIGSPWTDKANLDNEKYKLALVNDGSNWKQEWYQYNHKWTWQQASDNIDGIGLAWGETCEDVAQAVLDGGGTSSGSGSSDSSSSEKKEPTPMSYLDMIKDLISVWDGDVEVKIRQNKMFINKVPQPNPKLWIVDGTNVVSGQATVTDYNSDTINTLNVSYNGDANTITITDEYLINRFGEVSADLKAEKIVTNYTEEDSTDGSVQDESGTQGDGGESEWTQIAKVLQTYYTCKDSNEWNSFIRSVKNAKTGDEIGKLLTGHTKKKGQEDKSYIDVRHEIQKIKGMGY